MRPGGPAPNEALMQRDYLTDGAAVTEATIKPKAGDTVDTDFGGASLSSGLAPTPVHPELNPGGVPTWFAHTDDDDTIDYSQILGSDLINNVLMYAVAYLDVTRT
jgi:hypothetical protein